MDYFISILFLWKGYNELAKKIEALVDCNRIPGNQTLVPSENWHSTLFAIAKLPKNKSESPIDEMRKFFEKLPFDEIGCVLQKHLSSLTIRASEFRIYDNTANIQFDVEHGCLCAMRQEMANFLTDWELPSGFNLPEGIHFPKAVESKNRGSLLYGSFARRKCKNEDNKVRLCEHITDLDSFQPGKVQITVSDDELGNEREINVDFKEVAL